MRQNQALDIGILRDLSDHGRRHVQAPLDSDGSFRYSVARKEQIGVHRQSDEAFTLTVGISAKHDNLAANLYALG
jgi:hypothetical protein